jgi:cell division protein FtsB
MKRLWQKYATVQQHFAALVGLCLCFYFCYHLISGERSYLRLLSLNNMIVQTKDQLASLTTKEDELSRKVEMMKPGQVNADLLEEQVRLNLGYRDAGEQDVLSTQTF